MIESPLYLFAGIVFIAVLAAVAVKARAIDLAGALVGAAISFVAFLAGGATWLIIIITFFLVSSILTRYRYEYKRKLGSAQGKSGTRSWPNTIANGGVAALAALFEIYSRQDVFAIAYVASIAAAMSDTLATEVGLLSKSMPRLITNPRQIVKPGTSGGISPLGGAAALISAFVIGVLGFVFTVVGRLDALTFLAIVPSVVIGGVSGTLIDSLLGARFEGVRICTVCNQQVEDKTHHGKPTVVARGSRYVDNNVVNFLGIFLGAVISVALFVVFRLFGV